jgi:ABC-type lipoprotein export system ATPase subunit
MDQKTGGEILGLFEQLNREGHSIIMVTHDREIARRAKEILVLQDGQIVGRINSEGGGDKC